MKETKIYVGLNDSVTLKQLFANEKIDEDDLREKCFYKITFNRYTNPENTAKLNSLQHEYQQMKLLQACFTGKRVTGCVFFTLAIILLTITAFVMPSESNGLVLLFTILDTIAILGLGAIIATGILQAFKNGKKNEETVVRKKQIELDIEELLQKWFSNQFFS